MLELKTHRDFSASSDTIWALLNDFSDIEAWWPQDGPVAIEKVVIEGEGLGMIRHIFNHGMPHPVSERLDFIDPDTKSLTLSIVGERPAGIRSYQAHGQIIPLEEGGCRMTYQSELEAEPGREEEARGFLEACYELMFNGIDQAAQRG